MILVTPLCEQSVIWAVGWVEEQKEPSVYVKCTAEFSINIHLASSCRHARFQESKGSLNNDAIQQIAGTVDDQWGWGSNSSLL